MNERRRQREGAPRRADARDGRRRHAAAQGARARARASGRGSRRAACSSSCARSTRAKASSSRTRCCSAGVDALREERFAYPQPEPSFSRTLAHAYVTRGRWGKVAGAGVAVVAVAAIAFQLFVRGPELRQADGSAGRAHGGVPSDRCDQRRSGRARRCARAARDGRSRRRAGRLRRGARGHCRARDAEFRA